MTDLEKYFSVVLNMEELEKVVFQSRSLRYQDEKYFTRAFKRTVGMTPGACRTSRVAAATTGGRRVVPIGPLRRAAAKCPT